MSDQIADMLTRLRNGLQAGHHQVVVPYSKMKEKIGLMLVKEGFIKKIDVQGEKKTEKRLVLSLKYTANKEPVISGLRRISRPGLRVYRSAEKLPRVRWGQGITIVSTPDGLLTDKEARKRKIGGEIICQVW